MDQREKIGDKEEGIRAAIDGYLANVWTALPGYVVADSDGNAFNVEHMTVNVQITVQCSVISQKGVKTWVNLPVLQDCPIVFPRAGGFALTLPIQVGDEVLVVFASRCFDAWWQNSGIGQQAEFRMHDLSDGFAIPGPCSVPKILPNISTTAAQLRTLDGTSYIELAPGGIINLVAPGGVNITGNLDVDGNITVSGTGDVTVDANLVVHGSVTADDDGTFEGVSVKTHVHSGVVAGGGDTGPPT